MKSLTIILLLCALGWSNATAQKEARFTVSISSDSVLLGHYFSVTFTLENGNGRNFTPPEFAPDFEVVGGPSTSTSMSIVNGDMTQSTSYTYYLRPRETGHYFVHAASIEAGKTTLETEPVEVLVAPNPGGIPQPPLNRRRESFGMDPGEFWGFPGFEPPATPRTPQPDSSQQKKRKVVKM